MKIAIVGSRGIPAAYGGFETFAENISAQLRDIGHEVSVVGEKGSNITQGKFHGIRIIESAYRKGESPLKFYYDSLKKASFEHDILLVCGVGGAPFYPIIRKKRNIIVSNVDGLEHLRDKYSFLQKTYVRIAQKFASKYSDFLVADAKALASFWIQKQNVPSSRLKIIPYGTHKPAGFNPDVLREYGLQNKEYYILVARFVPENHILEIAEGFRVSGTKKKILIIGTHENTEYSEMVLKYKSENILMPGAQYHREKLDSLRAGAFAYLHGHSVGGTNPSLLESMSAGTVCICHDNPFNREVNGEGQLYFRNSIELAERIKRLESKSEQETSEYCKKSMQRIKDFYTWNNAANSYNTLFRELNG
ncbi:MAG: DUF1972 domain-containing protein [Bacteroidetes bacterium]|nr:MAG: DUF1972 domain-containing protein [Bacteroidota bacterium]REK04904.1 MAG: DUF1972 domain-containing protein [Bacteroidota bacterium]REK36376.1 MAG: DUF1972 domain-containing protein [Bacteroidota bacterium]REK50958.1 MAG: DUF1972 domain-containing protein [Bacteroidota bacterium]